MDSWIFQGGHPLVTASLDGSSLRLTQRRFRYLDIDDGTEPEWVVPVTLRASVAGETIKRRVLLDDTATTIELPAPPAWVVVNAGANGFFRVRYQGELLGTITNHLAGLRRTCRNAPLVGAGAIGVRLRGDVHAARSLSVGGAGRS